jgi:hypothetical protein
MWGGSSTAYTLSGTCTIGPSGSASATIYIIFPSTTKITPSAVSGQGYTGTLIQSNGAQLPLAGIWQ